MLFALHTTYFTFFKDDLIMVNWQKLEAKVEKETHKFVFD